MRRASPIPLLAASALFLMAGCTRETPVSTPVFEDTQVAPAVRELPDPQRCGTPSPSQKQKKEIERRLSIVGGEDPPLMVEVPVFVHVIHEGSAPEEGNVPPDVIMDQIQVLNDAFDDAGFQFAVQEFNYYEVPQMYHMRREDEAPVKQMFHQGGSESLNIYVLDLQDYLGYAYLPGTFDEEPYLDGVVIRNTTLPGGEEPGYDEGDTAVHEVGHWLGLYHTFDGACSKKGDFVDDTPAEKGPSYDCEPKDSCKGSSGNDPIHNYMDYTDDACVYEFTPGQAERMHQDAMAYRPGLYGLP